jgi:uncharacterized protein YkwD
MVLSNFLRNGRLLAATTLAGAVVVALLVAMALEIQRSSAAPGPKGPTTACANAGAPAADLGAKQLRKAVRCLVNEQRLARGAGKLTRDSSLERAARRHSKVMVATDCLAHRCGDEDSLERRIAKAGYFEPALAWEYAENTGCAPTAEAMVKSWMASREHRVYMLDRDFRELGVGSTPAPVLSLCEDGYTTFALVVAWRELAPER